MLGCSYEVDSSILKVDDVRNWLNDFIPQENQRWRIYRHPYEENCMILWFRFESDAIMFGLAHDRRPKSGARVFLSVFTRTTLMAAFTFMLIWMFLWSKLGYIIRRPFSRDKQWRYLEPDLDDFVEEKFQFLEPIGIKFEEWHMKATGGDLKWF